jgi:hypothetical protein
VKVKPPPAHFEGLRWADVPFKAPIKAPPPNVSLPIQAPPPNVSLAAVPIKAPPPNVSLAAVPIKAPPPAALQPAVAVNAPPPAAVQPAVAIKMPPPATLPPASCLGRIPEENAFLGRVDPTASSSASGMPFSVFPPPTGEWRFGIILGRLNMLEDRLAELNSKLDRVLLELSRGRP